MKFAGFAKLVVTLIFRAAGVLFYLNMERFLPGAVMLVLEKIQALPLGVLHMQGQYRITTTLQSAGAFLLSLPCIIFFLIFQRTLTIRYHCIRSERINPFCHSKKLCITNLK